MKILIADPSSVLCEALKEQLKCNHSVVCCNDGQDVIPMIAEHRPQLLVLGLELPNMDGLTILRTVRSAGMKMRVLAMTSLVNSYVVHALSQFDVGYVLKKPCSVCTALSHVYDMIHYDEQMPDDITAQLLVLGLRMNLGGFTCVHHAIRLLRQNPDQSLTKELYPNVARICGGTPQRVERAIRGVIRDAWMHRDERVWRAFFTVSRQGVIALPTNGDFIVRMAAAGKDNAACGY